ncbi:MAG TPA: FecR domain-containing protein [Dinghuibacter sp.]|jgi:ferric-dicitrate binding protein FerR (iron transport regulator)|uniref:FecR domain-containing protein n=1 Tax=Dinghuibacter sp. TaxID=2024697 RepID=UPI002CA886DD|nr:FecR domain-containing protein [Dinghuibacter sp.]HTJ13399.1 FecR domain-containing protein [Dinghuibacter sp.]
MENEQLQKAFRIAELIQLYQEDRLPEEEAAQLDKWLAEDPGHQQLVDEWDNETTVEQYMDTYLGVSDAEVAFETRIAPYLHRQEHSQRQYQSYWLTGIAAGLLAATLVTALWFANRKETPRVAQVNPAKAPVVYTDAGRNRAELVMSDGHRYALDEVPVGWVAIDGGTHIVKKEQGILGYDAAGNSATGTPRSSALNTITTPRGGHYKVVLPDGTVAWLNAASTLRFPVAFDGSAREVTLDGEGYFDVTQKADAPFVVHLDHSNTDIQVLGTRFDVLAYEDEPICKTTVLDGSVKVTAGTGASGTLQKGQQAQTTRNGTIRVVRADATASIAWTNDRLSLDRDITDIMRDISRWYDVSVEYQGDVTGRAFAGSLSRDSSLTFVLHALEATGSIHFTVEKGKVIVMP